MLTLEQMIVLALAAAYAVFMSFGVHQGQLAVR
jgi:hypothetical protein